MILMIDNYDSFTYNLVQYLRVLGAEVQVHRNDQIDILTIKSLAPDGIVISPGPGNPDEAGISLDLIKTFAGQIPILGVCLGHQAIVQAFGGNILRANQIMHGKTSRIISDGQGIFRGINGPFEAMRYHSLVAKRETFPEQLLITAESEDDHEVMGVRHRNFLLEGIQFHPESIMTIIGKRLLRNFLEIVQTAAVA
ncbi:MAG: aminodeoxychorismate/anthranilate synthase component II [Planctomycetaceae bacterium]|jgi:anthranilate synthase/aminodeoxychorismate synthase-like glutamine amidotransferase|nr:aminodeoxychorismate/anthranilate synthase component II [Planctomycetaceae bacterium]